MDWFDDYGYGPGYGYFGGSDFMTIFMTVISIIIGFILIFAVIGLAIRLTLYILRSLGLYRLASNRGMGGAGLAWIPFIGFYRIGSIADDISARGGMRSYYRYVLLAGSIFNLILSFVLNRLIYSSLLRLLSGFFDNPGNFIYRFGGFWLRGSPVLSGMGLLAFATGLAVYVVTVVALNKIYKCYRPASSTSWTVLSAIFPFLQSIFLFVVRGAVPVTEWDEGGYYPMRPVRDQDWQAPPQYPPYGQQPPPDDRYFRPQYGQGQPPYMPAGPDAPYQPPAAPPSDMPYRPPVTPPADASYQPPAAPEPPNLRELDSRAIPPPPQAPWEKDDGEHS